MTYQGVLDELRRRAKSSYVADGEIADDEVTQPSLPGPYSATAVRARQCYECGKSTTRVRHERPQCEACSERPMR